MSWDLFSSAPEAEKPKRPVVSRSAGPGMPQPPAGTVASALAGSPLASLRIANVRPGDEWTVTQLNFAAKELIEGLFPPLWITGEICNFTRARSGHCYFTLRDKDSQLKCVMWKDEARRLPTAPEEGMQVRALGRLTIYPARGDYQLSVTQLEAKGEGLYKLAMERLRKKLEAEGLTAPARRRALPRYPAVVGVVTSPSGAVFHDIVNVIRRRAPWTRVILAGCRVQGEGAAADIAGAIRRMTTCGLADVVIVGRGGGSIEDLWAFNEELVARAIAASPVPIISAVGHETDVTIADLVADLRAPTPSAAAESAVPDRADIARGLERDEWRLRRGIAGRLGRAQEEVNYCRARLFDAAQRMTTRRRDQLRTAARHLEAMSPMVAFGRGFAVPQSAEGRILRRRHEFTPGLAFNLRVADGTVPCTVALGGPEVASNWPEAALMTTAGSSYAHGGSQGNPDAAAGSPGSPGPTESQPSPAPSLDAEHFEEGA